MKYKKIAVASVIAAVVIIAAVATVYATGFFNQKAANNSTSATQSTTVSTVITKEYLKTDPAKGDAYDAAIKAYNEFLSGNTNAKDKKTNKTININDLTNIGNGKPGINSFALFDVNGDGIPELLTRSTFFDVFSYQNGQLVRWYTSINLMDAEVFALDNGAIFSVHLTTGIFYEYTTFAPDGTSTTITFADPNGDKNSPYLFENKEVSKKEYDNLTKEYFALSKKPASIEWYDY